MATYSDPRVQTSAIPPEIRQAVGRAIRQVRWVLVAFLATAALDVVRIATSSSAATRDPGAARWVLWALAIWALPVFLFIGRVIMRRSAKASPRTKQRTPTEQAVRDLQGSTILVSFGGITTSSYALLLASEGGTKPECLAMCAIGVVFILALVPRRARWERLVMERVRAAESDGSDAKPP